MNKVYIIVTILNGYKNIDGVFANKADAEKFADDMRNSYKWERHEVYVCEWPVW